MHVHNTSTDLFSLATVDMRCSALNITSDVNFRGPSRHVYARPSGGVTCYGASFNQAAHASHLFQPIINLYKEHPLVPLKKENQPRLRLG